MYLSKRKFSASAWHGISQWRKDFLKISGWAVNPPPPTAQPLKELKMKVYIASPLFTNYEKEQIKYIVNHYRSNGHEVYSPMEHQIENAWDLPNHEWARKVFKEDIKAINDCDLVVCLYYGLYSDSGTAWECGYAYGINKPVELVDFSNDEVSLMVVQSAKNANWFTDKSQT
jgi:nucleoside 2-deoxyribosyltransferase